MTAAHPARPFAALSGHQYMRLTTFRKSGDPVHTPVWFAERGGALYVYTQATSGKAKRVRANGRAEVAPSDARGTVLGTSAAGRARILPPEDSASTHALFVRKYGILFRIFAAIGSIRRAQVAYIEIAPAP